MMFVLVLLPRFYEVICIDLGLKRWTKNPKVMVVKYESFAWLIILRSMG